jgi:hypothetical protein
MAGYCLHDFRALVRKMSLRSFQTVTMNSYRFFQPVHYYTRVKGTRIIQRDMGQIRRKEAFSLQQIHQDTVSRPLYKKQFRQGLLEEPYWKLFQTQCHTQRKNLTVHQALNKPKQQYRVKSFSEKTKLYQIPFIKVSVAYVSKGGFR